MNELPRSFKIVTFWLVLGALVFIGVQWQVHRRQQSSFHADGNVVEIERSVDGHYHWPGTVNGRAVEFLIDTGASSTAIPAALATDLALSAEGEVQSSTAGGTVTGTLVRADLALRGGVHVERLRIVALRGLGDGGALLGMDVLGKLRLQQLDGVLRIDLRHAE